MGRGGSTTVWVPSASFSTMRYPYEPAQPAEMTVPVWTALTGVPVGAAKS